MRTKLALGLLLAVAALTFAAASATASGYPAAKPDPQATNVPYLAWNGEYVKVARCFDLGRFDLAEQSVDGLNRANYDVQLAIMRWTGAGQQPTIIAGTVGSQTVGKYGITARFDWGNQRVCFSGDLLSDDPGLAIVKLIVTHDGSLAFDNVFDVAWMSYTKPVLHELSQAELAALTNDPPLVGDPAGDGMFVPQLVGGMYKLLPGYVQVTVKGTFPFPGGALTMPDDWVKLANDPIYGATTSADDWNIHGSAGPTKEWGDGLDAISSPLFGGDGLSFMKVGPFDPVNALQTFLADDVLDQNDAPMPAAQIDLAIAAGGVGQLVTAEKDHIYVNKYGKWDQWKELYAPFYKAYIPATARGDIASGVDAANVSGNFPGFLDLKNPYEYWQLLDPSVSAARAGADANTCKDELGAVRPIPAGTDTASVYTDEHGMAIVKYDPDDGFYLTADSSNRCDLGTGSVLLGSSSIQAEAVYPYEPVGSAVPADPLTKMVYGDPMKQLTCSAVSKTEMDCTETIHDIYGNPVKGAEVQFTVEPAGVKLNPHDAGTTQVYTDYTDVDGQITVRVISTLGGYVDLLAENLGTRWTDSSTGVLRDACINYGGSMPTASYDRCGAPASGGGTSGGGGGSSAGGGGSSSAAPVASATQTPVAQPVGLPAGIEKPVAVKGKLVKAKLVTTLVKVKKAGHLVKKNGRVVKRTVRYLTVQVTGPNKTATIKVTLIGKGGKVLKVVNRKVAANKLVRVPNLAIAKAVVRTRVVVVG